MCAACGLDDDWDIRPDPYSFAPPPRAVAAFACEPAETAAPATGDGDQDREKGLQ